MLDKTSAVAPIFLLALVFLVGCACDDIGCGPSFTVEIVPEASPYLTPGGYEIRLSLDGETVLCAVTFSSEDSLGGQGGPCMGVDGSDVPLFAERRVKEDGDLIVVVGPSSMPAAVGVVVLIDGVAVAELETSVSYASSSVGCDSCDRATLTIALPE